ncbi:MAG: phage portal protein, partial [Oscillospiraceae bacterium]|nr:phage portal protein [Oscillospiraceae bacterium]
MKEDEILKLISEDNASEHKQQARKGQSYYEGVHDIKNCRFFYYNADGCIKEDTYRSNVKIPHPFFSELVDQAVQYVFSGDGFVFSENTDLQKILDEYFNLNEDFLAEVSKLLTGCIAKGSEYMFAYRNEENKLAFQCADSLCVVEVRSSETAKIPDYVIYWYADRIKNKTIKRVQVWDKEQVSFYVQVDNGKLRLDSNEEQNPRPHTIVRGNADGKIYGRSFGYIPFFRLDNNKNRLSGLSVVKELIDDYDLMASSLSNNLIDFDMPLYAITGFEGDNLDELQTNLKTKKIIGLDDGGGVEVKTVDVPYQARQVKLELDEKNIYRFGMGLNTAGLKDTTATTNIAIKAAYSLLDLKCSKLEIRLKQFLRSIAKPVLDEINEKENTGYKLSDIKFEFKHEIMSNALENSQIKQNEAN